MASSDYDVRNVFDDVPELCGSGGSYYVGGASQQYYVGAERDPNEAANAILHRARKRHRRAQIPSRAVIGVTDTTARTFKPRLRSSTVVGEAAATNAPVFNSILRQFAAQLPPPRLARVDDVSTYADFRAGRRDRYFQELEQRLAALEAAFDAHVADGHPNAGAWLDSALRQYLEECKSGGEPIQLASPEARSGKIECWRDGDEILGTARIYTPVGWRMVTSGAPVADFVDEVVICAASEGLGADELLGGAGSVAIKVIGAAKLVEEICAAAPQLVQCCGGQPGTVLGMMPAADPVMAAAMSLLQRCQRGDWTAVADVKRVAAQQPQLIGAAHERLIWAQKMKAKGRMPS
jgi:hypothetical protein